MVINVRGITKIYKGPHRSKIIANNNLTFDLKEGEILGLLGHNGAGKTTLANQILGLVTPTKGEIFVLGEPVAKDLERVRFLCSVQPQAQIPLGDLTPTQAVSIMGMMRGGKEANVKKRMKNLFESLDITKWANTNGAKLSGGVRRLTAFCMAVVNPGRVVILDEPTNDIDPVRRRYLWEEVRKLTDNGTSVILITHNVLEAEKAVDRVAILHQGQFLALGTPAEVKSSIKDHLRIEVSLATDSNKINTPSWALSTHNNGSRKIFSLDKSSVTETIEWARKNVEEGNIIDYTLSPTTLEDIYIEITEEKESASI